MVTYGDDSYEKEKVWRRDGERKEEEDEEEEGEKD